MIKRLSIKNFIGVQELDFVPGKVNIISGRNAKGKTSILEALNKLFTNQERRPKIIRENEERSILLAELDNGITVRRGITEKGVNLSVSKEGFKAQSPQAMLNSMIGGFAFNPVDFITSKDEKEQKAILLGALPIRVSQKNLEEWTGEKVPVDTARHGLEVCRDVYNVFYGKRRDANNTVKTLKAEVDAVKLPDGFDPELYRNVSLKEKYAELQTAQSNNETLKNAQDTIISIGKEKELVEERAETAKNKARNDSLGLKDSINKKIADLQAQIASLVSQKDAVDAALTTKLTQINDHKERLLNDLLERKRFAEKIINTIKPIDIAPLEKSIQEFEDKKALVGTYDTREEAKKRLAAWETEAKRLDGIVKSLAAKPGELIAGANLPVEGLGIDDAGNVTINGRPIKSLSTFEQINLSLQIARSLAGNLKLICVDGLEQLDSINRAEFISQAMQDDFQYFVSQVGDEELGIETLPEKEAS